MASKKKILVVYWSVRNLGVLDNIISELRNSEYIINELQFSYLQNKPISKIINIKSNKNLFNLLYIFWLTIRLNLSILFYKRIYLFGTNLPLLCPIVAKSKLLVCHYNEVPKFFDKSHTLFSKFEKYIFENKLRIVVSNIERRQLFQTINKHADYYVLDNILSYKYYEKRESVSSTNKTPVKLLYSGIISETREINKIVNAVRKNADLELTLVGEVDSFYAPLFFREISDAANIHYYGKVPFEKALELTNKTDFGIAIYNLRDNNNYNCAPVKIHEYFHYRKPVISLKNPPLQRISDEFGIIFTIDNIDDLSNQSIAEQLLTLNADLEKFDDFERVSLNDFKKTIGHLIENVFK